MYFVFGAYKQYHDEIRQDVDQWLIIDFLNGGVKSFHNDIFNRVHIDETSWGAEIYNKIKENPESYLIVEYNTVQDLYKSKEYKNKWNDLVKSVVNPSSNLGWIAPDGTFIGCDFHSHSFIARHYLGKDERELEECGYIKLFLSIAATQPKPGEKVRDEDVQVHSRIQHFTDAQKETLKAKFSNRAELWIDMYD